MDVEEIEERKKEFLDILDKLESEIEILKNNVEKCREILNQVITEEDALKFDEEADLEKGLTMISLYC